MKILETKIDHETGCLSCGNRKNESIKISINRKMFKNGIVTFNLCRDCFKELSEAFGKAFSELESTQKNSENITQPKRLTMPFVGKEGYWSVSSRQELIDRLAEYENTGKEPKEIADFENTARGMAEKLIEAKKELAEEKRKNDD